MPWSGPVGYEVTMVDHVVGCRWGGDTPEQDIDEPQGESVTARVRVSVLLRAQPAATPSDLRRRVATMYRHADIAAVAMSAWQYKTRLICNRHAGHPRDQRRFVASVPMHVPNR